jgi:hypothetical protein
MPLVPIALSDAELRTVVTAMQENDAQISVLYQGALRIGLAAVEPFPQLLAQIKAYQERLQSQLEGILLSPSDPFQDLVAKTAQEIVIPTQRTSIWQRARSTVKVLRPLPSSSTNCARNTATSKMILAPAPTKLSDLTVFPKAL